MKEKLMIVVMAALLGIFVLVPVLFVGTGIICNLIPIPFIRMIVFVIFVVVVVVIFVVS